MKEMLEMLEKLENPKFCFAAWILVIVGGLNWLFIGLVGFNIVEAFFGTHFFGRIIYIIVGLAAVYLIYMKIQKKGPTVV